MVVSKILTVSSEMGLHARPAAQLVHLADRFQSDLKLVRSDNQTEADCRSVLSMLMLAASKGTVLELRADGEDAAEAAGVLVEFFQRNFDEA